MVSSLPNGHLHSIGPDVLRTPNTLEQGLRRTLTMRTAGSRREPRARQNILAPETDNKTCFQPWRMFWAAASCCIPNVFLSKVLGTSDVNVRQAWREKWALCVIIAIMCTLLGFLIFGFQRTACLAELGLFAQATFTNTAAQHQVSIHGSVYDISSALAAHRLHPYFMSNPSSSKLIESAAGTDISVFFPRDFGSCSSILAKQYVVPCSDPVNFPGISACHPPTAYHKTLDKLLIGTIVFTWNTLRNSTAKYVVYNGYVLDVTNYLASNSTIFGADIDTKITLNIGLDVTQILEKALNGHLAGSCFISLFSVGRIETESVGCFSVKVILDISLGVIGSLIFIRFFLAVYFSWAISHNLGNIEKGRILVSTRRSVISEGKFSFPMDGAMGKVRPGGEIAIHPLQVQSTPTAQKLKSSSKYGNELYTIMLVTCYSESEHELRNTFNSLAMTEYSEDFKCLVIIADGLVKGKGNISTTPELILGMLELDPNWPEPERKGYLAVGAGSKELNYAKTYVAWYNYNGRSVPTILIVKTGNSSESEAAKPGNRGKRDSQIMLMKFLEHITFNERLCEFEFELFQKFHFLMGVTPDKFEIVLMVDADTKVASDSLARMVACMQSDPLVMGLCGETRIANKKQSYVNCCLIIDN